MHALLGIATVNSPNLRRNFTTSYRLMAVICLMIAAKSKGFGLSLRRIYSSSLRSMYRSGFDAHPIALDALSERSLCPRTTSIIMWSRSISRLTPTRLSEPSCRSCRIRDYAARRVALFGSLSDSQFPSSLASSDQTPAVLSAAVPSASTISAALALDSSSSTVSIRDGRNRLFRSSTMEMLSAQVLSALDTAFGSDKMRAANASALVFPGKHEHGDYQCNAALPLAKALGMKPRDIAEQLMTALIAVQGGPDREGETKDKDGRTGGALYRMDISGPGFINIHLTDRFVSSKVAHMLQDPTQRLGIPLANAAAGLTAREGEGDERGVGRTRQRIVVDFSSPNIAKEMHVGHLRSTIIGDSISRVLEFLGHDVLRLNHVGDWGTQFGMLIHYLKEQQELQRQEHSKEENAMEENDNEAFDVDIGDLVSFYKAAKVRFDEDVAFQEAARSEVVKLQSGSDPKTVKSWELICQKSRDEFQQIYDLLRVNVTERGESFYNARLQGVVQHLLDSGAATVSEGAVCVFLPQFTTTNNKNNHNDNTGSSKSKNTIQTKKGGKGEKGEETEIATESQGEAVTDTGTNLLPLMVRKSDGGFLYATTDLAAVQHRVQEEGADRVVYVTDAGQAQHFQMVFAAARAAGLLQRHTDNNSTQSLAHSVEPRLEHVPFGLVLGEDGKKIKSRAGDSVRLRELLDEAVRIAEIEITERANKGRERAQPSTRSTSSSAAAQAAGGEEQLEVEREEAAMEGGIEEETPAEEDAEERRTRLKETARVVGIAAVKYADLSMNRESNYRFSFSKMLALQGNTAPYMLYAYARIQGIRRRAAAALLQGESSSAEGEREAKESEGRVCVQLGTKEERVLAKHLARLDEVLLEVERDLYPSKICDYIFELSQKFNQFYEHCPVVQAPSPALRQSRTSLCALTSDTLKLCLELLGIETVDRL